MRRIKEAAPEDRSPKLLVGTAGWSIPRSHAQAFPGEGSHLARYAHRLDAVEINSSFYRPHRRQTYERWADSVPDDFRFSVKLPKAITHERRLVGCEALLDAFLDEASGLGAKLGVLLVQLPPSLAFGSEATAFFSALRERTPLPVALEPRHQSWADAAEVLDGHRIARVAADPPRFDVDDKPGGWRGLAYYRFHGAPEIYRSDYPPERLDAISAELEHAQRKAQVWCVFDNTTFGHALPNALAVSASLK